jgi:hypothetical protein
LGSRAPAPSRTPHASSIRGAPIGRRRGTTRRPRRQGMQMGTTRTCYWDPWRADCRRVGLAVLAGLNLRSMGGCGERFLAKTRQYGSNVETRFLGKRLGIVPGLPMFVVTGLNPRGQPYFFIENLSNSNRIVLCLLWN